MILVLDPNFKDQYFRRKWSSERYDTGMGQLEEVVSDLIICVLYIDSVKFDQYHISTTPNDSGVTPVDPPEPLFQYGGAYIRNAIRSFQQEDTVRRSPRDELHQYLQSDLETTTDVLGWWGVSQYLFECSVSVGSANFRLKP